MRKQIIITIILLFATAFITVVYFKNLNPPGLHTNKIMRAIPDNAALVLEFNNDRGFYEIFSGNKLFTTLVGQQKIGELDTLRRQLLSDPSLAEFFIGQNIFISVHPTKTNDIELLFTISAASGFGGQNLDDLNKKKSGLVITPLHTGGRQGYNIYINALKKSFYIINDGDNIFSGSFSKDLITESSLYKIKNEKKAFVLLSEQQNANSLANLYVNYAQLSPIFDHIFQNKNSDIFKSLRLLSASSALSLNYRSDALMFNGSTVIKRNEPVTYLNLFASQQPVENHLKDIFPSTTAYSVNFAVSDPSKFVTDLSKWQATAGLETEKNTLFKKIKTETSVGLLSAFNRLLGKEFAVVTTRYIEKFAIISVNDGSKLKPLLSDISKMTDGVIKKNQPKKRLKAPAVINDKAGYFNDNTGLLNYEKLPFFLLGDAFSIFRHPYFLIIDNYLILANSKSELASFYDIYINRKFLSKNNQYSQFDNLLSASCNVDFFFNLKNSQPILKRDLYPDIYTSFENTEPGLKTFYASSFQFTAADKNFYTNFCLKLNADTTDTSPLK